MGDFTIATGELVAIVWSTVWILATAVHLGLWLVWVLWLELALCHRIETAGKGTVLWLEHVEEILESGDHVLVALANGMGTGADWIGAGDFVVDNIEIVVDLFWCAIGAKVKSDATVALGEFEAMHVLRVDWIDTGHNATQWPIAQVQAVATITVHIHQLGRLVVVEEDLAELRVAFFTWWCDG